MSKLPNAITSIWANHPHAKLWLGISAGVILTTALAVISLLNIKPKSSQVSLAPSTTNATPTTLETESTAPLNTDVSNQPAPARSAIETNPSSNTTASPASEKTVTPASLVTDSPAKALVSELNALDLDGLTSQVENLQSSVGQFNN